MSASASLIRQTHQWLLAALLIFICGPALYAADIPALVRASKPAVVQLLCYDQDDQLVARATGFFISSDGKLVTCSHVLEGSVYSIRAKGIDGHIYSKAHILSARQEPDSDAGVVMEDDVAELRFDDAKNVPCLTLGSSSGEIEGQRVIVIGNPEGLGITISDGLISAFREHGAILQISAPISEGSSGSPVIDAESGKVIAIAESIYRKGQNLNFAVSIDSARVQIAKGTPATKPSARPSNREPEVRRAHPPDRPNTNSPEQAFTEKVLSDLIDLQTIGYINEAQSIFDLGRSSETLKNFDQARIYYGEAIDYFTEAIRLEPYRADTYEFRAKVYDARGNLEMVTSESLKYHAKAEADRKNARELASRK